MVTSYNLNNLPMLIPKDDTISGIPFRNPQFSERVFEELAQEVCQAIIEMVVSTGIPQGLVLDVLDGTSFPKK